MINIQTVNFTNKKQYNSNLTFAGHKLSHNANREKVYKFYLPKHADNEAKLGIKKFYVDKFGEIKEDIDFPEEFVDFPSNKTVVEINPDDYFISDNVILGYRFLIDGKQYNDTHRNTISNGIKYNIADRASGNALEVPISIYHMVPNILNPKVKNDKISQINALGEKVEYNEYDLRMNHFMRYDTTLQDIIEDLPRIQNLGFRKILSTPLFGQDNLTAHGYWPTNLFRLSKSLGTMKDYEKFQIELFKRSMGFISDGAFTDEGLDGIHILDILKHGEKSSLRHWFDIYEFPIKMGVLPTHQKGYENFDIKVVNSPVIWDVDKNGKPIKDKFGKKNPNYNPFKETFIQLYDKRLTSDKQIKADEIFNSYDIKNPPNVDDITKWDDSVLPYNFPVPANEIIEKSKLARINNNTAAKEYLLSWKNFELIDANNSSGIQLLTGNKNLAKLRLTLPVTIKEDLKNLGLSKEEALKLYNNKRVAVEQTRNYIFSTGQYWTNKTAKILRNYIAQNLKSATNPQEFVSLIKTKVNTGEFPSSLNDITVDDITNILDDNYFDYATKTLPNSIEEMLKEFPIEALEVSPILSSTFSTPLFKAYAEKSLYERTMTNFAIKILEQYGEFVQNETLFFDEKGNLNKEQLPLLQLMGDKITRYLLIKGLNPKIKTQDIISDDKNFQNSLNNISLKSLGIDSDNPTEEVVELVNLMKNNILKISNDEINVFAKHLFDNYESITNEQIKVANYIIDKTEAGLSWRYDAAKDIADIEGFVENQHSLNETWDEARNFWQEFNRGVNFYNPHAYKILEITDAALNYNSKLPSIRNQGELEASLIENTDATTQSNYNYYFDLFQRYFTDAAEDGSSKKDSALKLINGKYVEGWEGVPGFLYSGNKNNLVFSHAAVGNHDKQRVTHNLSINTRLAYSPGDINDEILQDINTSNIHFLFFPEKDYLSDMPYIQRDDVYRLMQDFSSRNIAKMAAHTDALSMALANKSDKKLDLNKILKLYTIAMINVVNKNKEIGNQDLFFNNSFEKNFADILNELKLLDNNVANVVADLRTEIHMEMVKPAIEKLKEIAKLMVALPGNPTWYAGDELLELGGEEKAKNIYLQNRNRIHREYLTDKKHNAIEVLQNDLSKIFNLRNDKNLSSLVDGDTVLLKSPNDKIVALYRYNDKDDAIILLQNEGYNATRKHSNIMQVNTKMVDFTEGNLGYTSIGLPDSLIPNENVVFVNALNPDEKYKINNNKQLVTDDDKEIVLNSGVTILRRV